MCTVLDLVQFGTIGYCFQNNVVSIYKTLCSTIVQLQQLCFNAYTLHISVVPLLRDHLWGQAKGGLSKVVVSDEGGI